MTTRCARRSFPVARPRVGRATAYIDDAVNRGLAEFGLSREAWDVVASLRRSGPPFRLSPTQLYVGLANERAMLRALEEPERRALAELLRKLLRALELDQPLPPRSGRGGRRRSHVRTARARGRPEGRGGFAPGADPAATGR